MKASVLGAGRSGQSVAKLLMDKGYKVVLSDIVVKRLQLPGVEFDLGHTERILDTDLIVLSPGIPTNLPILQRARERGIPIYGELEVSSWFLPTDTKIIAITGTNGKTTTAYLTYEVIKAAGYPVVIAGNMGIPLSERVNDVKAGGYLVLEVSSFQLETIDKFRPYIGVWLNFVPEHLDRYRDVLDYWKAKARLFMNQTSTDFAILNKDVESYATLNTDAQKLYLHDVDHIYHKDGTIYYGGKPILSNIHAPVYMMENLLAVTGIVSIIKLDHSLIKHVFSEWKGLPHRMELVAEINGVRFINNSMCTNPTAFVKTLESIDSPIILIAGGKNKNLDITPIVEAIKRYTKHTLLIGETASLIKSYVDDAEIMEDLPTAVKRAVELAEPGDVVLLSPGFASFDMFRDFAHRGEVFRDAVQKIKSAMQDAR